VNIHHFESEIDKKILARGYDYYLEGNVLEVSSQGNGEYFVQIEGSEVYEVEIKIDGNGRIVRSACDCPYDIGPVCKHEVAVYYELRDILNGENNRDVLIEQAVKHPDLKEVLNALSKAQLVKIITEITKQDIVLKNSLIFKYSQGNDAEELDKCKKLITSIVKKHRGREGFIGYREASDFVQEMMVVLEKAGETDDPLLEVDIACLVLEEAVEAFQYADDSDGDIGWLVDEALERINETIADNAEQVPELREKLFQRLLRQSDSTIFDGWEDYRVALLVMCAQFADVSLLRDALKAKIEDALRTSEGQKYKEYTNEALLGIWLDIIREYGTAEETEQFIADNLHYSSFREALIDQYMQENNYEGVVELALEGERQDKNYAGLVLRWQEIRYGAYRELQFKEEQKQLAERLLFAGKFEYYNELRQLGGEDHEALYDRLKQKLKREAGWSAKSMYLKLIAEANDLDEMMAYVKENPAVVEEYAGRLAGKYADEISVIYGDQIRKTARSATKRKDYQGVCGMLRRYQKTAGEVKQAGLIDELRQLYANKPAFMDELNCFGR
jgi:Uncharacterized conserved protein